jgi:actin-like ATPase involved in cell morphogenesis
MIVKGTGVAVYVAEAPMACVAMGAGKALENYAIIRRGIGGL